MVPVGGRSPEVLAAPGSLAVAGVPCNPEQFRTDVSGGPITSPHSSLREDRDVKRQCRHVGLGKPGLGRA